MAENKEILRNFILDCKNKSDQNKCHQEDLDNYNNCFDHDGKPKIGSSWIRINNDPDGHCFYHSIWRFIVMTRHRILGQILFNSLNREGDKYTKNLIKKPGWNKQAAGELRQALIDSDESLNIDDYTYAREEAYRGEETDMYAGDGEMGEHEFQAMANLLDICIAIFFPKISSVVDPPIARWHIYCPNNNYYEFCDRDLDTCKDVAFIINSNLSGSQGLGGNHFETLIPCNIELIDLLESGKIYTDNEMIGKYFEECIWDIKKHRRISNEDINKTKKIDNKKIDNKKKSTIELSEDISENRNAKQISQFKTKMMFPPYNFSKSTINSILEASNNNLEFAETLLLNTAKGGRKKTHKKLRFRKKTHKKSHLRK